MAEDENRDGNDGSQQQLAGRWSSRHDSSAANDANHHGGGGVVTATAVIRNNNNSNKQQQRHSPRKARRPPQRFVARASKQGWGVADGDRAFLENDARYCNDNNHHKKPHHANASSLLLSSPTTTALASESVAAAAETHPNNRAKQSKLVVGAKTMDKSKGGGGNSCTSVLPAKRTKAEADASSSIRTNQTTTTTTLKRKSAISRRPRQLRPTEKMIAFRNDMEEEKRSKILSSSHHRNNNRHHHQKQQRKQMTGNNGMASLSNDKHDASLLLVDCKNSSKKSKKKSLSSTTTTTTTISMVSSSSSSSSSWQCSRCSTINLSTKSRCSSCQGWRGGKREGLLMKSSSSTNMKHGSRRQHSSLAMEQKRGKQNIKTVQTFSAATTAAAVTDANNSEHHGNGAIPTIPMAMGGDGGSCIEHYDNDVEDAPSSSESFEEVVCCLCKCAVDFSDREYFLPPSTTEDDGCRIGNGNGVDDNVMKVEGTTADSKELLCSKTSSSALAKSTSSSFEVNNCDIMLEDEAKLDTAVDIGGEQVIAEGTTTDGTSVNANSDDDNDNESMSPSFQLPYRFYDPTNALILCDGPAYAKKNERQAYKCERAFHQHCHFVPVLSIPRGTWRCLVCKYHDEMFLNEKSSLKKKKKQGSSVREESDDVGGVKLSNVELNAIYASSPPKHEAGTDENECAREGFPTMVTEGTDGVVSLECANVQYTNTPNKVINTIQLEQRFEALSAPLKSRLLHTELTTRSRTVIKASLATIRTAEHSLRSITETSKARKALAERVESEELGLPQELCQSVMRIALCKTRIRDMIFGLEDVIRSRPPHHDAVNVSMLVDLKSSSATAHGKLLDAGDDGDSRFDPISELMQWYLCQQNCYARTIAGNASSTNPMISSAITISGETTKDYGKSLLHHLFPQGNLSHRRSEPRTGEARIHNSGDHANIDSDGNSVTSISLDDLVCWTCHGTDASDENDMLLCDGVGCCRAFHMKCLEPKLSLDDVHKSDDENWFCPLCTAHATLIHYAQCEYFGDDLEESPMSPFKKGKNSGHHSSIDVRISEWETAKDVFADAPLELRIAQKLKDNIRDEETTNFLAEDLGIVTQSYNSSSERGTSNDIEMNFGEEDDGSDDDFDNEEEELIDDESLAEEDDLEWRLAKEKIDTEELDALSITSDVGTDDDNSDASAAHDDGTSTNSAKNRVRRSRRKRFIPPKESNEMRLSDIGTLDVANIVRGKRSRTKVDYRK